VTHERKKTISHYDTAKSSLRMVQFGNEGVMRYYSDVLQAVLGCAAGGSAMAG
jgi:hypothetical protein